MLIFKSLAMEQEYSRLLEFNSINWLAFSHGTLCLHVLFRFSLYLSVNMLSSFLFVLYASFLGEIKKTQLYVSVDPTTAAATIHLYI